MYDGTEQHSTVPSRVLTGDMVAEARDHGRKGGTAIDQWPFYFRVMLAWENNVRCSKRTWPKQHARDTLSKARPSTHQILHQIVSVLRLVLADLDGQ